MTGIDTHEVTMRIRLATTADIARLRQLHDERIALLALGGWRVRDAAPVPARPQAGGLWVGEKDGLVGGFVQARQHTCGWVIDSMALDAHTYYPGLARQLVGTVCKEARLLGVSRLLVRVPLFHPVEQAFWRALGAVETGRRKSPKYEWMKLNL
jgi:hypothetical protein